MKISYLYAAAVAAVIFAPIGTGATLSCTTTSIVPTIARAEGRTEPVGDFVLTCTGGTPTPANSPVPQMNLQIALNTNISSGITADSQFSEALLLIDEPNSPAGATAQHPLLNCGQTGAPDNGINGPGVCEIISTGNPSQTYDGSQNTFGTGVCAVGAVPPPNSYTCGRPNAFQGRLPAGSSPALNQIVFLGVPLDPPGAGTRILRITNLRADAASLGPPASPPVPIISTIAISGPVALTISDPQKNLGVAQAGLTASISSPGVIHLVEGFAFAWRDKNLSFTAGNGTLGNATFSGTSWTFNGHTNYPPDLAQNVPGVVYNTESMYQWQNNGANGPPSPNPPPGFGGGTVANLGAPLDSRAFGGVHTGIKSDGVADAGTRIALKFDDLPASATINCPAVVHLQRQGTTGPNTGVMVLTATNDHGAGAFTATTVSSTAAGNLAVYQVLYADPFSLEFADVVCTVDRHGHGSGPGSTRVKASFAPFYHAASAGHPTPTTADPSPTPLPRFIPGTDWLVLH